jgi:hypothetical protein
MFYILVGKNPMPVENSLTWGKWLENARKTGERIVGYWEHEDILVSTVFLGIDHNFTDEGPPILFETMILGGPDNQSMWRYATWEEAEAGHMKVCNEVKAKETSK